MKTRLILLCSILFIVLNNSLAQDVIKPFNNTIFGIKGGINFSNINFNKGYPTPGNKVNSLWKPGLTMGCLIQVPLRKNLNLQTEYLFSHLHSQIISNQKNYKLNYLSLPILLKYKVLKRLSVVAGPQFDLLISGFEVSGDPKVDITKEMENRQIGVSGGVELNLLKFLNIELRGMHGFNKISIEPPPDGKEFKLEFVHLGLLLFFK